MGAKLGDLLVQYGVLTVAQRDEILIIQRDSPRPFGQLAEELYNVSPAAVERAWAEQYAALAPKVDPRQEKITPAALTEVDRRQAWQFRVLPMRHEHGGVLMATTVDFLARAMKFTGWRLNTPCEFLLAEPLHLGEALVLHYPLAGMKPHDVLAASASSRSHAS